MKKAKVLYALCGTGQGHMTKAMSMMSEMKRRYNVEYLVSSLNNPLLFEVDHILTGATFYFKNGGLDILETYRRMSVENIFSEVMELDLSEYDMVINDHEPVSAYASYHTNYKNIFTLSHQASFAYKETPRPKVPMKRIHEKILAEYVLKTYAKNSLSRTLGLHFQKYNNNIFYPLLREQVLKMKPSLGKDCLVYLPKENSKDLLNLFSRFKGQSFKIFDPKATKDIEEYDNVTFLKTDNNKFLDVLETCSMGIVNSGFELPSEMLYLGKKIMTIPQKRQYEQECNAAALMKMGIETKSRLSNKTLSDFIFSNRKVFKQKVSSPAEILDEIESRCT